MPDSPSPPEEAADPSALILVVDDHPINRMVMRSQITALGHVAEDVESGPEALERWRTGKFSLVLTDLNMPVMSGYDLCREIRATEAGHDERRTPIIACSANVIPGVVEECMAAGMDDYIAKPTKLMELSEKLNRWLPAPIHQPSADFVVQAPLAAAQPDPRATLPGPEVGGSVGKLEPRISQRTLAHFRQVNDVDVIHLLEAVEQGDMEAVTHNAHRIKGACGFIGATALASVCGMIEHAGRQDDAPGVSWLMDAFHSELEHLNATIDV